MFSSGEFTKEYGREMNSSSIIIPSLANCPGVKSTPGALIFREYNLSVQCITSKISP